MIILFNFATRSRPDKLFRCLDNIHANCQSSKFKILLKVDDDDTSMNNDNVKERLANYTQVDVKWGESKNKVHAINRDIPSEGWDILINTSDDMWFTAYNFDNIIRDDFSEFFPDLDGFLHYNDFYQKDNVCTMSIMGKPYYDRFKYVYYHEYISLWCDNEATDDAKKLGKYKYMGHDKVLFHHKHPAWGLAAWDAQYQKTEDRDVNNHDRLLYERRKNG